ncbi:MAG: CPBP family glutamic-type intramembrane protease [Acidimicrobiaceae bacterium]|nr:CPBP family glutamic-type intramembrane protease [Acidimicrobiaceae bacterium]
MWELTPAAAARKCDSSAWRHLNPVVLVRPDWKRCHSPRHIAQCLLIFAALDFGGVVALGIFAEVVLAIGDVGSRFAATTIDPSWLVWTLLLLVYAPLGEEAMCRWPIAQRPRAFLLLPGVYIAVAGITGFPDAAQYLGAGILLDAVAIAVGLGLHLLSGRVRVLAAIDQHVDRWLLRWPAVPVWLMISCFALAHLARYEIDWSVTAILVIPVVVLPWLWFGALASIVRIRFGWWSAVMLHAAVNLVVLLIDVVFGLLALL